MPVPKPTVDEFLDGLDHARVDDIRRFRACLLADDADIGERIKWNAPSFGHDGDDRVTFRLQPGDRFDLVLHRGVHPRTDPFVFDDPDDLITWSTTDRGVIAIPEPFTTSDQERVLALVRRWLHDTRRSAAPSPGPPSAVSAVV